MFDRLLSFLTGTAYEDLPDEAVALAKRSIVDWVGVAIGGSGHPSVAMLTETVKELGGRPQAVVLGTPVKTSAVQAALVNGAMSHVLDFDDTHLDALMHPSAPLVPALLAYGEWKQLGGKDLLLAFLLGVEIETRISMALGESHYAAGWHSTATMGRLGAAAGVGKLAGLDRGQLAHALGLAGTQAAGIRKVFGHMAKSFHPGKAAADGLLAVLLAQRGYTSSENILDGDQGLGAVLSTDFNPQRGLEGLGATWAIQGISIKPFASCLYTHPVIDAVIRLRNQHHLVPERVASLHCEVSKFCMDAACQQTPRTGLAAKFSTSYCAALALVEGQAGEAFFQDAKTRDPRLLSLMQRVSIEELPSLKGSESRVVIRLQNGTLLENHVQSPLGSPERPLADSDLNAKAAGLLGMVFDNDRARIILQNLWALETMDDISQLMPLLAKKS